MLSKESSFFADFSVQRLVEHHKSFGLTCDPRMGGGGGGGTRSERHGPGVSRFNSRKSDGFTCSLTSNESFDETAFLSALRNEVRQALDDTGADVTDTGSSGPASFYFAYEVTGVRGRVELVGRRIGARHYSVRAVLNEGAE
jgi:hypothetical protein